jgi:hypothetical protein
VTAPVILASHLTGARHFTSTRHMVVPVPCRESLDYYNGVLPWWSTSRTICIVEHDMQVDDDLIQQLLDCPEPFCSWSYWLGLPSGGPHWAHRTGLKPPCGGVWIETGDEWADFGGIGFCKIEPSARVRPLEETDWTGVDCAVSRATDCRVHVHWKRDEGGQCVGVEHYHH